MGWGSALLAEARAWWAAWRHVAQNPLAHYFRLARRRRIAKTPAWRRRLPYLIVATVVLAGAAIPAIIALIETGFYASAQDIAMLGTATVFSLLSVLFLVYMLTGIYETAIAVMGLLGQPGLRIRGQVLDDMTAVTIVNDFELTAAIIRLHWPRLMLISLFGAGLLWLWLLFLTLAEGLSVNSYQPLLTVLAFGPLTIGALAFSGALAGLIYILWLICAGRGLGSAIYASSAGVIIALAHLVATPLATGVCIWLASELSIWGLVQGSQTTSGNTALLMALGLAAGFALVLYVSEQWAGVRPFALIIAPFLIPAGAALIAMLDFFYHTYGSLDQLAFEYIASWRAFSLANAAISLPPPCFGSWNLEAMGQIPLEWYRYPVLILSQLLLAATGLYFARRAVQLRRRNFE